MIEANLRIEKARKVALTSEVPQAVAAAAAAAVPKSERLQEAERDVRTLEDNLASARQRFTDEFPDVKSLKNRLDIAKKRRDEVVQEDAEARKNAAQPAQPTVNRQDRMNVVEIDGNIQRWESQSAAKDLEMAQYDSQIKQVQANMARIESQINSAPLGEQQYGDLLRGIGIRACEGRMWRRGNLQGSDQPGPGKSRPGRQP
jgi:hypothetical protein